MCCRLARVEDTDVAMRIPERIRSITPPPMEALNAHAARLSRRGAHVISLGQGVPGFPAAPQAIEAVRLALEEPETHIYSPDAGLPSLRQALAAALAEWNGIEVDPEKEIIITAGANQAFMLAAVTLLEPGDRILLPSPFYFNHEMAVRAMGGVPVEVPLSEETGYQMRMEHLEAHLASQPQAMVMISPNNPTGAVYDPRELKRSPSSPMKPTSTSSTKVLSTSAWPPSRRSALN
jgi:aspartate/methionine/tyrosine aminotransferase